MDRIGLVGASFVFCPLVCIAQPLFIATEIAGLGGDWTLAYGINASGDVVGSSRITLGEDTQHAFLFSNGKTIDIHPPGAIGWSAAQSINSRRQVAGNLWGPADQGFVYSQGEWTILTRPDIVGVDLKSINEAGQVAGAARPFSGGRAMFYAEGVFHFIDPFPPAQASAQDINNSGHVVGNATHAWGERFYAFWHDGLQTHLIDIGDSTFARAINDTDEIVGSYSKTAPPPYVGGMEGGFLYSQDRFTDIGDFGGIFTFPEDINNHGQIVGGSQTSSGSSHGFLYQGGVMYDINNLLLDRNGIEFQYAYAINDNGQIIGYSMTDGKVRAYLLTPLNLSRNGVITSKAGTISEEPAPNFPPIVVKDPTIGVDPKRKTAGNR